ncbi:MAG: hypothetical protein U0264_14545 [Candidatus Kapaibacterium sp.]
MLFCYASAHILFNPLQSCKSYNPANPDSDNYTTNPPQSCKSYNPANPDSDNYTTNPLHPHILQILIQTMCLNCDVGDL